MDVISSAEVDAGNFVAQAKDSFNSFERSQQHAFLEYFDAMPVATNFNSDFVNQETKEPKTVEFEPIIGNETWLTFQDSQHASSCILNAYLGRDTDSKIDKADKMSVLGSKEIDFQFEAVDIYESLALRKVEGEGKEVLLNSDEYGVNERVNSYLAVNPVPEEFVPIKLVSFEIDYDFVANANYIYKQLPVDISESGIESLSRYLTLSGIGKGVLSYASVMSIDHKPIDNMKDVNDLVFDDLIFEFNYINLRSYTLTRPVNADYSIEFKSPILTSNGRINEHVSIENPKIHPNLKQYECASYYQMNETIGKYNFIISYINGKVTIWFRDYFHLNNRFDPDQRLAEYIASVKKECNVNSCQLFINGKLAWRDNRSITFG